MVTDLLGRKERFNVPGTASGSNWTRRLHTTVAKLGGAIHCSDSFARSIVS